MNKHIFLTLPLPKFYHYRDKVQPLGLLCLGTYASKAGYRVSILDTYFQYITESGFRRIIRDSGARIFGISCHVQNRFDAFATAKIIKKEIPDSLVVLGGPFPTICHKEILEDILEVDIVVRGEGELSFLEIIQAYEDKKGFFEIDAITYRDDGRVIVNSDRMPMDDLDNLLEIDYDLIDWRRYPNYFSSQDFKIIRRIKNKMDFSQPTIHFMFGRGCPYNCLFCSSTELGFGRYRIASAKMAFSQIKRFYEEGVNSFVFWDDHLLLNKKWFDEFYNLIISSKIRIIFKLSSRVDALTEDNVRKLREIGAVIITLGIESGSDAILKKMNKGISTQQISNVIALLKNNEIVSKGGIMLDTPGETLKDITQSIRFFDTVTKYSLHRTSMPVPMEIHPGTQVENIARSQPFFKGFRWTKYYFEKRNLFLNASPFTPIYENIKTERVLRYVCLEAVRLKLPTYIKGLYWLFVKNPDKRFLDNFDRLKLRYIVLMGFVQGLLLLLEDYITKDLKYPINFFKPRNLKDNEPLINK